MNQSRAIDEQRARAAAITDAQEQINRLRQSRAGLAEQLALIEGRTGEADAEDSAAAAALSAAITAHALGEADIEAVDAARARSRRAAVTLAALSAQRSEAQALRASISSLEDRGASLAQRILTLEAQGLEVTGQRLRELGADLHSRQRILGQQLAALVAEGRALQAIADRAGVHGNFAVPYLHMPTLIMDALGGGDRIVIDVNSRIGGAVDELAATLRAEGFKVA